MMNYNHALLGVAATSIFLGSADPVVLGISAIASQLPDLDTSTSVLGRILLPISQWLEKNYPHRSITHSFLATGAIALLTLPIALLGTKLWQALVLGYFCGWFGDVFTKSGVAAFYPSAARLVIPGNPQLRLSTGSNTEYFVMGILVLVVVASININSSGGILRTFNSVLGMPSGAVEIVNQDVASYLLIAKIRGRNAITQELIEGSFEVVRSLSQTDLLVKDSRGLLYQAGTTQNCQIAVNHIEIQRSSPITATIKELRLESQDLASVLGSLKSGRTYISGMVTLEDAEELHIPTQPTQFAPIKIQPAQGIAIAHLDSASPAYLVQQLGDYFSTGTLVVRSIHVRP